MAVLLVGMSVAAVLMTAAMPVWKQMSRREREEELVFRGQQYVRAIGLFQRRSGPGVLPPNVNVLVNGRFLRKKYKDPITNDDFDLLSPVQSPAPGAPAAGRAGAGQQPATATPQGAGTVVGAQAGGRGVAGGIMGVASKSKDESLRVYNGRTHYNEWQFVFVPQTPQAGGPGGVAGGRGGPQGGRGQGGRGQSGTPPFGGPQGGRGRQGPGPAGRGLGPPAGRGLQRGSPFPTPQTSPFQPPAPR